MTTPKVGRSYWSRWQLLEYAMVVDPDVAHDDTFSAYTNTYVSALGIPVPPEMLVHDPGIWPRKYIHAKHNGSGPTSVHTEWEQRWGKVGEPLRGGPGGRQAVAAPLAVRCCHCLPVSVPQ